LLERLTRTSLAISLKGGRRATDEEKRELNEVLSDGAPRGLTQCVTCGDWTGVCQRESGASQQAGSGYDGTSSQCVVTRAFLFNDDGDCMAAKLRPGSLHTADEWDELLAENRTLAREGKHDALTIHRWS
jgi:hypothetical protein